MSIAEILSKMKPEVKSANKWHRSKFRRKSRGNPHKKNSPEYEKKPRKIILNYFEHDKWRPCPSGYPRGEVWNLLFKAWLGYKIANNPKNKETLQDKLHWAQIIQNVQTDLGLQRSSFPQLSLLGDVVFLFDKVKEREIEDLHNELELEEWKKKKKHHIQEIVDASMLTDKEIEMMREFGPALPTDPRGRYVERIVMV